MSRLKSLLTLLLLTTSWALWAQSVAGIVTDAETGEPLIGATIIIPGTQTGCITDFDGHFEMAVKEQVGHVSVSYMGYQTLDLPYRAGSPMQIALAQEQEVLDEVIVIGYGVQKKSDLTGSVSSVAMDDVRSVASTNVAQALQGKAAGVEVVSNSGAPGSSISIRIRGMGTVNNSEPLYVVDGAPVENIENLSSDDIESIEILKDAASAAIYGARAANGVVLVTTKDGSKSKRKFNLELNMSAGMQGIIKQPNILSPEEYASYYDYVLNAYNYTVQQPDGSIGISDYQKPLVENANDWWKLTTRTGAMYKAGLAISGGDKDLNYYLSGNYTRSDGIVKQSDYQRINLTTKINARPVKNLLISAVMTYANSNQSVVASGANSVVKAAQIYNPLTTILDDHEAYTYRTPIEVLRRLTYTKQQNEFRGQLGLNWDIIPGLTFVSRGSFVGKNGAVDRIQIGNTSEQVVGSNKYKVIVTPTSSSDFSWDNTLTLTIFSENGKNALTKVKGHSLNLMAGETMEMYKRRYVYATGFGYGGYDKEFNSMSFAQFEQAASSYTLGNNQFGFIARLNYNYKGRYYLQSNFRADASSRFSRKNRWGFFPSVSVGWKISGEEWMQQQDVVSLLKIRAGWGQLGNNQINDLSRLTLLSYNNEGYIYGSGIPSLVTGMAITQYGNENIRWERTESSNVGIDLNFLRNRLTSSIDLFIKETKDMLIQVPIVYSSGFPNTPYQNAGSVRNKGIEVQLGWKDQVNDFSYSISGNISHVSNVVTSLGEKGEPILGGNLVAPNALGYVTRTTEGLPIGCYYGYMTDGLMQPEDFDEAGKPVVAVMESTTPYAPGDMKYKDINADGKIDDSDRTIIGSPHPDLYYGFNINLGYKGIDLTMFFQGSYGNDVFNVMRYFNYSYVSFNGSSNGSWGGEPSNVNRDYFDRVYRGGDNGDYRSHWGANPGGDVPRPSSVSARSKQNYYASDFYVEDGSYLRLKNIQLSYTFPKSLMAKAGLGSLKVYANATNVFTITRYGGLDPEVGKTDGEEANNLSIGLDEGTYPQSRTIMFGLIMGL